MGLFIQGFLYWTNFMLYVKFAIHNKTKFSDFQELYAHVNRVRQPGFRFEVEEKEWPGVEWVKMTEEEIDEAYENL